MEIQTQIISLTETKQKKKALLTTFNLLISVNFEIRIQNDSRTATENIFVDNRLTASSTSPPINDPSKHDAKFLTINNT